MTAGADKKVGAFVFFVVFGLWCIAVLMFRRLVAGWRRAEVQELDDHEPAFELFDEARERELRRAG